MSFYSDNTVLCEMERPFSKALPPTLKGVVSAKALLVDLHGGSAGAWSLDALAGRFIEVRGGPATAALTMTTGLLVQAQQQGKLAVWVNGTRSTFFPPDLAASGVDLTALPVIRVPNAKKAARVADTLLRSGSFAIIVLDLGSVSEFSMSVQTRLVGLAKKHHTTLLCITQKSRRDSPHGSLVSLRLETEKKRDSHDCFVCELHAEKDKQATPGWRHKELCCGPDGLC